MVHWVHFCRCGSHRLVSFPATSIVSAPCPDFVYEKLSSPDVVQLALFSHGRTGRFLSLISDDSILLRAVFDSQFRSLLSARPFPSDPSRYYANLQIQTIPSKS